VTNEDRFVPEAAAERRRPSRGGRDPRRRVRGRLAVPRAREHRLSPRARRPRPLRRAAARARRREAHRPVADLPAARAAPPRRRIRIFIDRAALLFARAEPTELEARISWRNDDGARRSRTVRHDLDVAVYGLSQSANVLYAATHGRGAYVLTLPRP